MTKIRNYDSISKLHHFPQKTIGYKGVKVEVNCLPLQSEFNSRLSEQWLSNVAVKFSTPSKHLKPMHN